MNKNLTEKIYKDMTTLLKEKNLISSIPSLTIVEKFKEVDCQAYIVTHEVNGIEKYDIYVNDASYDDIVKNLKVTKEMLTLMSPDKKPTLKITLPNKVSLIKFGSSQEEFNSLYSEEGYIVIDIVGKCNANE